MTNPLFSRSGNSNPLGPATEDVRTKIPEEAKGFLTALSVVAGQSEAEYIRELILEHLYGHAYILRLRAQRGRSGIGQQDDED